MRHTAAKVLHVLALGLWFGGAGFFNFVTAPTIFDTFKEVVAAGPSDRTAHQTISPPGTDPATQAALANALAGAAVGPVFPKYFAMQAGCALVAGATALGWWNGGGTVHRRRVVVIGLAALTVAVAWPVSTYVSELRVQRFDPSDEVRTAAKALFGPWHLVSLGLSFVTVGLAGVALAMATRLPPEEERG